MGSCHPPGLCWAWSTLLTVSGLGEAQRVLSTRGEEMAGVGTCTVQKSCDSQGSEDGCPCAARAVPGGCA